jgi:hypothetical protein
MKKYTAISFAILFFYCTALAQPPVPDTVWGGYQNQALYNQVLEAPVVTGGTQAITIIPNRNPFCFDKKVTIKSTIDIRVVEQCLYLDTKGGLVAYVKPVTSAASGMCDIKPEDEDFFFSVIGLKGNVFIYSNTIKNGLIEHWVRTGNTQNYVYQGTTNTGVYTLHNKQERRSYCNDKFKGTAYKYDGDASPALYLFGKTYPPDLHITANKYIGNFGIGYQETDKGLYIVMENVSSGYTCKITSIEDVEVCFDPSSFKIMEDEFLLKRSADLQAQKDKVERNLTKIRADDECASQKRIVLNFEKEQLRIQEENLTVVQQGNAYQNQNVQNAYASMMDPMIMLQGSILSTDLSICNTEVALRRNPSSTSTQNKLSCLRDQRARFVLAVIEMAAIEARYPNDTVKGLGEKSRVYWELMKTACN